MHDFQAFHAAPRFAETAYTRAAGEAILLLRSEIKKPQRQEAGAVADSAQHLPAPAEGDFRQQHLALDRRPLAGAQLS
jgi:hypothetical protein